MKKLASILAVTLAAGVLATGCGSSSGSASKDSSSDSGKTVIKAATGANAKPYVYVGDDDKPAGYDVDVLNAVFDKLPDYELEYEVTDFGSVLSGLNSGNYQIGVNNFSYNEDRGASYLFWIMQTIIRDICQVVSSRELQSQEHLRWSQSFCFWMSRHLH